MHGRLPDEPRLILLYGCQSEAAGVGDRSDHLGVACQEGGLGIVGWRLHNDIKTVISPREPCRADGVETEWIARNTPGQRFEKPLDHSFPRGHWGNLVDGPLVRGRLHLIRRVDQNV